MRDILPEAPGFNIDEGAPTLFIAGDNREYSQL